MSKVNMKINRSFHKQFLQSIVCWLCMSTTVFAQTQLGADIDGEAAEDQSGYRVSISSDGSRIAIGARKNDDNGTDSGHVRVYQWSGSAWEQLGNDIDGAIAADQFGGAITMSSDGNRLAISSVVHNSNAGQVRVFQWSGSVWEQFGADIDGEVSNEYSGRSVSMSSDGNRLSIGVHKSSDNGVESGKVRIYQWSGSAWEQLGADIDGEAAGDDSGYRISMSSNGDRLAIGAHYNNGNGVDAGHVRVYQWSGTSWAQLGTDIDGEAIHDLSSRTVSLSSNGDRLAIGAPWNDGNGVDSGHVRVYQWSGSAWEQLGTDIDGEIAADQFGYSVSLSSDGERLAVSAIKNNGNGDSSGHARVYQWSGSIWEQLGADIDGEAAGDESGYWLSMSSNGDRLAIGARFNDGNGVDSGHVRVFDLSMFNIFKINAGLNDAWYNPVTSGQGFFVTVFPDIGKVFLSWFTYDTEFPPMNATANLGDPGHRWLTAFGAYADNQAVMNISITSGGIFDSDVDVENVGDGTIILTFEDCNSGTVEYDIPSINRQGTVPIQRIANDNIALCEAL